MNPGKRVLRAVYLDPELDAELRAEALARRVGKNDLIRECLERGVEKDLAAARHAQGVEEPILRAGSARKAR